MTGRRRPPSGRGGVGAGGAARALPVGRGAGSAAPAPGRGRVVPLRRRRRRRLGLRAALLAAALVAVAAAAWLAVRAAGGAAPATAEVRSGELELAFSAEAVVVRDEWVQVAAAGGPVERLVEEGRRVRAGHPVVRVGGAPVAAERPGIVSYQVDGLEPELRPDRLPWLEEGPGPGPGWLSALPQRRAEAAGAVAAAGQPLFRLLEGDRLWLLVAVPAEPLEAVAPGARVQVRTPVAGQDPLPFAVAYKSQPEGGQVLVALASRGGHPEALLFPRRVPVTVTFGRYAGLIIPRAALTVAGGRLAVQVEGEGGPRAVAVQVLGRDAGDLVAVAPAAGEQLQPGDRVRVPGTRSLQQ